MGGHYFSRLASFPPPLPPLLVLLFKNVKMKCRTHPRDGASLLQSRSFLFSLTLLESVLKIHGLSKSDPVDNEDLTFQEEEDVMAEDTDNRGKALEKE